MSNESKEKKVMTFRERLDMNARKSVVQIVRLEPAGPKSPVGVVAMTVRTKLGKSKY